MSNKPPKPRYGDYPVGYRRPPRETQFQPGQSGNPKGRPKGQPSVSEMFMREATRLVRVQVGDRVEMICKLDATFRKLFSKAISGDPRAMSMVFTAVSRFDAHYSDLGASETSEAALDAAIPDIDAIQRMMARFDHLTKK